jgi:sodium/hydrogen exchanger family protein
MLLDLAVILIAAKLAAELCERISVPAVVGEIVAGILIGPSLLGWVPAHSEPVVALAELGVLLLLVQVGMEIDLAEFGRVGRASMAVAVIGVAVPFALGGAVGIGFGESGNTALLIGAALTATSVGITARMFGDLRALATTEARVVLGAAVADRKRQRCVGRRTSDARPAARRGCHRRDRLDRRHIWLVVGHRELIQGTHRSRRRPAPCNVVKFDGSRYRPDPAYTGARPFRPDVAGRLDHPPQIRRTRDRPTADVGPRLPAVQRSGNGQTWLRSSWLGRNRPSVLAEGTNVTAFGPTESFGLGTLSRRSRRFPFTPIREWLRPTSFGEDPDDLTND